MRTRRFERDERGAAAVIFALTAVVLFGVGAFAVDIGQAYAKKSLEQTDVDVAVMAAAAELNTSGACNQEVIDKATEYLQKAENSVSGQEKDATGTVVVNLGGSAGDKDGYISCKDWRVDLWAPASRADFALAGVLPGAPSGIDVDAHAAAQIKAARGGATLPFFAVTGCDYGQQTIRSDSSTPATPPTPVFDPDTSTYNNATFTIAPNAVASATSSAQVTITGNKFNGATEIGFTRAAMFPDHHHTVSITPVTGNGPVTITVPVPSEVLANDDVWFVRVMAGGLWSEPVKAQPFTVGPPKLYCDASNEGNFGTIDVPRTENSHVIELNIINGVEPTLAEHPTPTGECSSTISKNAPVDGTNCVATAPGLKVAETNRGLITGIDADNPGRLDTASTSNCSRSGNSSRTVKSILGKNINDDLLSCFITTDVSIQDLIDSRDSSSAGYQALSADIFNSPRFFWIPVFNSDPDSGKKYWPIKGFRPGFISDEDTSYTRDVHPTITDFNGIVPDDHDHNIRELKVILFDRSALPEFAPTVGGEADYTGSGPKALVLVE